MHTVFALLCFVVVIHWLIFPYPSGLLHWHCGNLTIAPVPAKQPWWIWINTSCEFIMNDCITTTKQSTTKPCAYFLGYTVPLLLMPWLLVSPDQQQPWYWLCQINRSLSSMRPNFNYMHHSRVDKWYKLQIHCEFQKKKSVNFVSMYFTNSFYKLISWALPVKLVLG